MLKDGLLIVKVAVLIPEYRLLAVILVKFPPVLTCHCQALMPMPVMLNETFDAGHAVAFAGCAVMAGRGVIVSVSTFEVFFLLQVPVMMQRYRYPFIELPAGLIDMVAAVMPE